MKKGSLFISAILILVLVLIVIVFWGVRTGQSVNPESRPTYEFNSNHLHDLLSDDDSTNKIETIFPTGNQIRLQSHSSTLSREQIIEMIVNICSRPAEVDTTRLHKEAVITYEENHIRVWFPQMPKWHVIPSYDLEAIIEQETGLIIEAWRFYHSTNTVQGVEWDSGISDEVAIRVAKEAIEGRLSYKEELTIRVEHLSGNIKRVVFPGGPWVYDRQLFVPGASFSAEVLIDASSGKVLRVSSGG